MVVGGVKEEVMANDGGPAFPTDSSISPFIKSAPGMSLRDWFAGQALTKLACDFSHFTPEHAAKWAYRVADAMLEARKNV